MPSTSRAAILPRRRSGVGTTRKTSVGVRVEFVAMSCTLFVVRAAERAQLEGVDRDERDEDYDRQGRGDAEVVLALEGDVVDELDDRHRAVVGPALGEDVEL